MPAFLMAAIHGEAEEIRRKAVEGEHIPPEFEASLVSLRALRDPAVARSVGQSRRVDRAGVIVVDAQGRLLADRDPLPGGHAAIVSSAYRSRPRQP